MKTVTLPNGIVTKVPQRFDYKFCIAIKAGSTWISSWARSEDEVKRTLKAWKKIKEIEYKVIPC